MSETKELTVEELQEQYIKAINALRVVKGLAKKYARSGNPARKDAGEELLRVLP